MGELLDKFQIKIKVIEQKVHILSQLELLPEKLDEALLASCKVSNPLLQLFSMFMGSGDRAMGPEEEEIYFGDNSPLLANINESDNFLNEGLKIVLEGMSHEDCAECGECEDKKRFIEGLLAGRIEDHDLKNHDLTIHSETIGSMQ